MKIALIGYGKMGKEIHQLMEERGHELAAIFDSKKLLNKEKLNGAEVCIDFTRPELAVEHMHYCIHNQIPLVIGTTGWYDQLKNMEELVRKNNASLLYASNFSIGVNLFFELSKKLAELMQPHSNEYSFEMEEIHHLQKLDAPSGTAISLANIVVQNSDFNVYHCIEDNMANGGSTKDDFPIYARRLPEVPGTHTLLYESQVDKITITHEAKNRKGFALGSIIAAEWLQGKKGFYNMSDVLK